MLERIGDLGLHVHNFIDVRGGSWHVRSCLKAKKNMNFFAFEQNNSDLKQRFFSDFTNRIAISSLLRRLWLFTNAAIALSSWQHGLEQLDLVVSPKGQTGGDS
jgi:hypothetical protein